MNSRILTALFLSLMALVTIGCQDEPAEHNAQESLTVADNEEESGNYLAKTDTFDEVRRGIRLVLGYDAAASAFSGTVENVTDASITAVRVEVHLAGGRELGPTPRLDLQPGQVEEVHLPASEEQFSSWTAHAESGEGSAEHPGAHGEEHEGEHEGEHGREGREEH